MRIPTNGFSAFELMIGVALLILLFALALAPFSSFREAQVLNAAAADVASLLSEARALSIASKESSSYGVHFEASRAVLFKGAVFTGPSAYNKEVKFDGAIETGTIALEGGGSDVVFERLTGETPNYGSVTLRSKGNTSKQKTVTVLRTGIVSHN